MIKITQPAHFRIRLLVLASVSSYYTTVIPFKCVCACVYVCVTQKLCG